MLPRNRKEKHDEEDRKQPHIVYVHGTFAAATTNKDTDQESDHLYMQALRERYHATVESHPWSGSHLDLARRNESGALAQRLTELHGSNPARPLHVFAHSHGGNLLGLALQQMAPGARITSAHLLGTPVQARPATWDNSTLDHVSQSVTNYFAENDPVQTTGAHRFNEHMDDTPGRPRLMGHTRRLNESEGAHGTPVVRNTDLTAYTASPLSAHSDLHHPRSLPGLPPVLPPATLRQRTVGWHRIDAFPPAAVLFPRLNIPANGPVPPPIPGPKLKRD